MKLSVTVVLRLFCHVWTLRITPMSRLLVAFIDTAFALTNCILLSHNFSVYWGYFNPHMLTSAPTCCLVHIFYVFLPPYVVDLSEILASRTFIPNLWWLCKIDQNQVTIYRFINNIICIYNYVCIWLITVPLVGISQVQYIQQSLLYIELREIDKKRNR